jgi:hypothetical protein
VYAEDESKLRAEMLTHQPHQAFRVALATCHDFIQYLIWVIDSKKGLIPFLPFNADFLISDCIFNTDCPVMHQNCFNQILNLDEVILF